MTDLERARADVERVLGPKVAARVEVFTDGGLYVRPGEIRRLLAWFLDFVVFLLLAVIGVVALALADRSAGFGGGTIAMAFLGILLLAPALYGLACYRGGRAFGGVSTGTRLVRMADGGRVGTRAPWAMLVRTVLMPLLLAAVVTGGTSPGGTLARTSVDVAGTGRLHAAGFHRLVR
ncbi:hypothetical protein BLA60_37395 [Actinophytocola xinjiangensis]|uniref:RDD domain-containing protein n=1 Tax=Actinophytocola xinjiangensis TaxID=485602 RepID=A0A7Z1AVD5_9PSEU|nr:RDD family protein [Actinophytocola xinjiangensis]OLF05192.1 hypothetical protein BLA60_37395 [Actinophytocola xinjiangensis]